MEFHIRRAGLSLTFLLKIMTPVYNQKEDGEDEKGESLACNSHMNIKMKGMTAINKCTLYRHEGH